MNIFRDEKRSISPENTKKVAKILKAMLMFITIRCRLIPLFKQMLC